MVAKKILLSADLSRGAHCPRSWICTCSIPLSQQIFVILNRTHLQTTPRLHCWKIRLQTKNVATVECINICIIHLLDQISKLLKDCLITYNILCVYMDQLEQSNGDNFCCLLLIFMTTKSTTQKSIVKVDSHVFNIKSFFQNLVYFFTWYIVTFHFSIHVHVDTGHSILEIPPPPFF